MKELCVQCVHVLKQFIADGSTQLICCMGNNIFFKYHFYCTTSTFYIHVVRCPGTLFQLTINCGTVLVPSTCMCNTTYVDSNRPMERSFSCQVVFVFEVLEV